jgi:hypothetical protein
MIMLAVNVGLTKIDPVIRMGQRSDTYQYCKRKKRNKSFFIFIQVFSSLDCFFSELWQLWCSANWSKF